MGSQTPTPDYGRRLLPVLIDQAARDNPDHVVYSFPLTDSPAEGFWKITNSVYANAINRTSWWLQSTLGRSDSFESIGYIGPNDLRYMILTFAAVKCGYKIVLLSPRNSLDGHLGVIDKCDCNAWLLPAQRLASTEQILAKRAMRVAFVPELKDLLDEAVVEIYPYEKTFDQARGEPLVVLHTSGSTGLPKPVVVVHGLLAVEDAFHLLPEIEGQELQAPAFFCYPHRGYSTFPDFHAAGLTFNYALPFFYGLSVVLGPPNLPVNLELIDSMFDHADIDASMMAPSTLEEISKSPSTLERMRKHAFSLFGGGPIAPDAGNKINSITRLINIIGTTEGALFPMLVVDREDWNYFHFHPVAGFEYKEHSDGLFEQFQVRNPEYDLFQSFFQTFPDVDIVPMQDLYSKHPMKPDRWLYKGRTDDVLVLSNGEKVNPLEMEATVVSHPAVRACLVVGQAKFQVLALIELIEPISDSEEEARALKDNIWEIVKTANSRAPGHAQIHRNYIMYSTPDKPFMLAGKGTVLRGMTTKLYQADIDRFYRDAEAQATSDEAYIDIDSLESVRNDLTKLFKESLDLDALSPDDELFSSGLDSLGVFAVLRKLRTTLSTHKKANTIPTSTFYGNTTVAQLSKAFYGILNQETVDSHGVSETAANKMQSLLVQYTQNLPQRQVPATPTGSQVSVILTGSTGSLGSYLLDSLLSMARVDRIYCLNRSADGRMKQAKVSKARGLSTDWPFSRVKFLQIELSEPDFGLGKDLYEELIQNSTHIIPKSVFHIKTSR